jgi:hypothetical protein
MGHGVASSRGIWKGFGTVESVTSVAVRLARTVVHRRRYKHHSRQPVP